MTASTATNLPMPVILVRGFGGMGVEDERRVAYQGFNDGTVYPGKRGENYIYEGLILRFMKSAQWTYNDATNVVGYYGEPAQQKADLNALRKSRYRDRLASLDEKKFFSGDRVVVDPAMALNLLDTVDDVHRTLWVFRYYDLERKFSTYAAALVRLIEFIRELAAIKHETAPKVNIIAHSMGGLIVREAVQCHFRDRTDAEEKINKIVTLGTPHQGITFQFLSAWSGIQASEELERFSPKNQSDETSNWAFANFAKHFDLDRLLCVVGTNYKTYGVQVSSWANRLFSVGGEFGLNYNRSDGLVKQSAAQVPGAPRTFVHKCHGGVDSLVTSREAFEIATRFFFGNVRARLRLLSAKITSGQDAFGKSEFFFGVSIKPRRVDFDLFHQSAEAENCYGPFHKDDLSDKPTFDWARGENGLIWEGWLNTRPILEDPDVTEKDMVFRLDFYVGERDLLGIGFSDNVIFRQQHYIRVMLEKDGGVRGMYCHRDEKFERDGSKASDEMPFHGTGWEFKVAGDGFQATLLVEAEQVGNTLEPSAITAHRNDPSEI